MSVAKRLVVCGGNGFLGSRVCKYAVARGWDVTSISRSGEPRWDNVTSSAAAPAWSRQVSWERGDILRPATYVSLLKGADYVVHSMGILLEADYKGVVSGKESPIAGLRKAFAPVRDPGVRDLDNETVRNPAEAFSYEVMNRDSAVVLAEHAAAEKVSAFCFVSAAGGAPILPTRYISTKREAEALLQSRFPEMRSLFARPPFMYDSSRPLTMAMAAGAGAGSLFNTVTGNVLKNFLGTAAAKPVKVETVAEAIVEGLSDESVRGPIETPQLEELATKGWRKGML